MQNPSIKNKTMQFIAIGFIVLVFIVFSSSVFAVEYGGAGIRPAYPRADNPRTESIFVHTTEPGAVINEGVTVVNNTDEQKTMLIDAVDSTPSTGGAFACAQTSEEKKDVGDWIKLEQNEVTVDSGSGGIIPFTITVPQNASVGEHNGCYCVARKERDS